MTYLVQTKDHYQDQTPACLTNEEILLFYKENRRSINAYINEADYQYIKENKLNMSRIIYFLVHEWLQKKRAEWGELDGNTTF